MGILIPMAAFAPADRAVGVTVGVVVAVSYARGVAVAVLDARVVLVAVGKKFVNWIVVEVDELDADDVIGEPSKDRI